MDLIPEDKFLPIAAFSVSFSCGLTLLFLSRLSYRDLNRSVLVIAPVIWPFSITCMNLWFCSIIIDSTLLIDVEGATEGVSVVQNSATLLLPNP